jgi:uncharacterized membrane protein
MVTMMRKGLSTTAKAKLKKYAFFAYVCVIFALVLSLNVYATEDVFTAANRIIRTVYNSIAGISTVLAGLMSSVAVIGAKLSNNQQKTDQSWDWLKRIWVAWAIINGIGAFIAYITPLFRGLNTLTP